MLLEKIRGASPCGNYPARVVRTKAMTSYLFLIQRIAAVPDNFFEDFFFIHARFK